VITGRLEGGLSFYSTKENPKYDFTFKETGERSGQGIYVSSLANIKAVPVGGRRINRKSVKKTRKNRRRYSRRK
jgi:hypothetical protein